jgi:hypothetical protein
MGVYCINNVHKMGCCLLGLFTVVIVAVVGVGVELPAAGNSLARAQFDAADMLSERRDGDPDSLDFHDLELPCYIQRAHVLGDAVSLVEGALTELIGLDCDTQLGGPRPAHHPLLGVG